jgi:hypothetical protein
MDRLCIEQIDKTRPLEFSGLYPSTIRDPQMVALAEKTGEPNLLNLMSPIGTVKIDGDDAAMFLSLCATEEWRQHIERDLQSMCETSAGEPLLTAFLSSDDLDAIIAPWPERFSALHAALKMWRAQGITALCFDGYEKK